MGQEAQVAQGLVDLPEHRLVFVQRHEGNLGLDGHGATELLRAVLEDGELRALDVDLQEIQGLDTADLGMEAYTDFSKG